MPAPLFVAGGGLVRAYCTGATKGGAVEARNALQSWIVDSNAVWSGNGVRRYNRGFVRLPAPWTATTVQFDAVSNPGGGNGFAVVVDGAYQKQLFIAQDSAPHNYVISGLTLAGGGSTVEIWEPTGSRSNVNSGVDSPYAAGYLTSVYLPYKSSLVRPTATTGIITIGDSIFGTRNPGDVNFPNAVFGCAGQLRLLAHAQGWLLTSLDYSSACMAGDGLSSANWITWIAQAAAAMGNPATVKVIYLPFRNDWSVYGNTQSNSPTACQSLLQAVINGLAYQHIVCTNIPQSSESANAGGFTLPNYRTAEAAVSGATILDGTSWGINTATDLGDGIHPNAAGVAKMVAGMRGALGL